MGQSNSKYHRPEDHPANTNAVAGASTAPQLVPPIDTTPDIPGPRRSSFRKSILKFVKPSNIRNRISGSPTLPTDTKRSWRRSRRWSKAPIDDVTAASDSPPMASSSTSLTAGPSEPSSPSTGKGKEKEKDISLEVEDSSDAVICDQDEALPSCSTPSPDHPLTTPITAPDVPHVAELETAQPQISDLPFSEADEPNSVSTEPAPIYQWEGTEAVPVEPPPLIAPPPTSLPPIAPVVQPRQFPPPGTLVVVQGIVHTTDVSRNNAPTSPPNPPSDRPGSATPTPSSHSAPNADLAHETRSRNRLSTLLRRAGSSSAGTSIAHSDSDSSSLLRSGSQPPPEDSTQTTGVPPTEASDPLQENIPQATPPSIPTSPPAPENRAPVISSSSIDVLGTLLSVAAAATAASLLTGSSEPILSSGLAPPNIAPSLSNTEPSFGSSPSTPSLPSYPRPDTPIPDISAAGRTERMRQAWGTIRERLGLRPSTTPPASTTPRMSHPQDDHAEASWNRVNEDLNQSAPDTREMMLAEMARAFNIGLGLNGLGGLTSSTSQSGQVGTDGAADDDGLSERRDPAAAAAADHSGDNARPPSQPETATPRTTLPPEGSFERFLVDLQNDLRTALTQPEDETASTGTHSNTLQTQAEPQASTTLPENSDVSSSLTPIMTTQPLPVNNEDLPGLDDPHIPELSQDGEDSYADMPSLQAVSDSESEFDDAEDNHFEHDEDELHPAQQGSNNSPTQSPNTQQQRPREGTSRIDASGRINWWRLYRFPPILSPRVDLTGVRIPPTQNTTASSPPPAPESTVSPDSSNPPTLNSSAQIPQPSASPPSSTTPSHPSGEAPSTQSPLHSVVPVIVVGLQSVNQEWRPDLPTQGDDGIDLFGQPPSDEIHFNHGSNENGEDDDLEAHHQTTPTMDGAHGRGRGRGRGWHSRAANAIRNLRPGRRPAETTTGFPLPIIAPGSRTFLIYVIGGYYPPDHNIVTGGSNILDSFEALLELADLLGQAKPPTVSKEDIDKSGLEIIKAAQLVQHEKDGKVSSNCLDRCLICLDDYEQEDPIRVMSCRHAFHKTCVDEWLQRGRNNCPACRSTGVTGDSHTTTIPMPTS